MSIFKHLLDLSDYPEDHILHEKTNKKVPLMMTDELNGKVLKEVVCLRLKLYSIDYLGGTKQSAKGVQKSVKKTLPHSLFKNCLLSKSTVRKEMTKSVGHQIVVNSVNKVALSCFDDKRYILDDIVSSLTYGHYSLTVSLQESSKSEKSNLKAKRFQFCFLIGKFSFVANNECHTESGSSNGAVDEICSDTDDDNADHETDDEDMDVDSTASTASNYNKAAPATCSANFLFVNNDGPLAKAWNATSSFCELVTLDSIHN